MLEHWVQGRSANTPPPVSHPFPRIRQAAASPKVAYAITHADNQPGQHAGAAGETRIRRTVLKNVKNGSNSGLELSRY
jgi:hypothetical protein